MPKYMLRLNFLRRTHIGTPITAEITSNLNGIRRHYWEASRKEGKRHEHEQKIRSPQGPDESPSQFYKCL
jgi:uncharacterized protein YnzC (UPF0291/DUF896 family)